MGLFYVQSERFGGFNGSVRLFMASPSCTYLAWAFGGKSLSYCPSGYSVYTETNLHMSLGLKSVQLQLTTVCCSLSLPLCLLRLQGAG